MARLQITDLNPSESGLLYKLTDEELLNINGGGLFGRILGGLVTGAGIIVSVASAGTLAPVVGTGLIVAGSLIYDAAD